MQCSYMRVIQNTSDNWILTKQNWWLFIALCFPARQMQLKVWLTVLVLKKAASATLKIWKAIHLNWDKAFCIIKCTISLSYCTTDLGCCLPHVLDYKHSKEKLSVTALIV